MLLTLAGMAGSAEAGRTRPLYRMEARAHGAPAGVSQEQIRRVVVGLAEQRGWAVHVRTAGVVETDAEWGRGKHRFTIVTVFDDRDFVIRYVSSYNLGYSDTHCRAPRPGDSPGDMQRDRDRLRVSREERCVAEVIHPSYNDFVEEFENDIAAAVPRLAPAPGAPAPVAVADSVAEEKRRLEALQASGMLTAEELQSHQRLLAQDGGAPGGAAAQASTPAP